MCPVSNSSVCSSAVWMAARSTIPYRRYMRSDRHPICAIEIDCATPAALCLLGAVRLPSCQVSPPFPATMPAPAQMSRHIHRASATGINFSSGRLPITKASTNTLRDGTSGNSPYFLFFLGLCVLIYPSTRLQSPTVKAITSPRRQPTVKVISNINRCQIPSLDAETGSLSISSAVANFRRARLSSPGHSISIPCTLPGFSDLRPSEVRTKSAAR